MKKKSAHWTQITHLLRRDEYECSACGFRADKPYDVCPHCGLRMKGSKRDASWVDEIAAIDIILGDER